MDKTEQTKESKSQSLTVAKDVDSGLNVLNLLDEKQLIQAEALIKRLMGSEKGGIKSVSDGIAILVRAQDLKLPFSSCIEHIHVINNKTGIDIHIIRSLLLRAGVVWECTKDYTPQYQYTDGNTTYNETQLPDYCVKCRNAKEAENKTTDDVIGVYPVKWFIDLKGNAYREDQVSEKCVKAINKAHALKIASEGKFPVIRIPAQPVDYVTEFKFTRYQTINGKEIVRHCTSRFSLSEAQTAELVTKDTYKKYARIFISHRAFTFGAREIASDLLMGCMETTELKLLNNVPITEQDIVDTSYEEVTQTN